MHTQIVGYADQRNSIEDRATKRESIFRKIKPILGGLALAVVAAFTTAGSAAAQNNVVTIQQVSSGRFVDAHEFDGQDWRLVTRPAQNNNTQLWRMVPLGGNVYTFQQMSNNRFVDAHEHDGEDFRLVTRPAQNNNTQRWLVLPLGGNIFTIQQVSNGRYVDAHEHEGEDYRLVTRPAQNNATQQWRITVVYTEPAPQPPQPVVHSTGSFQLMPQQSVNLDNGVVGQNGADIAYQVVGFQRQLAPVNGAQFSYTNGNQRGFAGCNAAAFNANAIPQQSIPAGHYICVRTSEGRVSEFRITNVGQILGRLDISYTTWQ
ncbi:MAG: RICIN domain-containing protein [Bauldia sp.]